MTKSRSHINTHSHNHLGKVYQNIKVKTLPESEVEIESEITAPALAHFRDQAVKHFQEELEIPGFRKGHVPEKIVLEKIGELPLLEEAGELALKNCYAEILKESNVSPLGAPNVSITKLAIGSRLSFKITIAVFPEFTLKDYQKIASEINGKKEKVGVSEKEVDEAVNTIRRLRVQKNEPSSSPKELGEAPHLLASEGDLPPLTEELVKTFGKFESIADFREKLRESLIKEKDLRAREKIRLSIIKSIIEKNEIPLPRILIDSELDRMIAKMKDDIERMGLKMQDYLKQIKKTEIELRLEWQKDAKERAKMELILQKIAKMEKIEVEKEEIEKEVKHLTEHYQDAGPLRASSYFEHVIRNEKVFQFLESQR